LQQPLESGISVACIVSGIPVASAALLVSTAHTAQVFYLKERYGWFTAQCTAADPAPHDELEDPIDERRPLLNDG
jgi:cytolysin (calcineurin-like family phosphatase)